MDSPLPILSLAGAAVVGAAAIFPKLRACLALSRAKHRSLTGHAKMSRLAARLIPFYEFDISDFFRSDGAPAKICQPASGWLLPPRGPLPRAVRQGPANDVAGLG